MSTCGGNTQRISSYLAELLTLSPAELRAVGISLQASPTASAAADDKYNVPSDQDLVVFALKSFHRFTALGSEANPVIGINGLTPEERTVMKMQNCIVQLQNLTRNYNFFDAREQSLLSLRDSLYLPQEAPFIVPAGHVLKASFSLVDTTLAGQTSIYGLLLTGVLIPKRG